MNVSIKLDIAADEDEAIADVLHELTAGLDLTFDQTGTYAAGGWPEVEFTGPATHLAALLTRYHGDDVESLRDGLAQLSGVPIDPEMRRTLTGS
jgi:hypothetical protein